MKKMRGSKILLKITTLLIVVLCVGMYVNSHHNKHAKTQAANTQAVPTTIYSTTTITTQTDQTQNSDPQSSTSLDLSGSSSDTLPNIDHVQSLPEGDPGDDEGPAIAGNQSHLDDHTALDVMLTASKVDTAWGTGEGRENFPQIWPPNGSSDVLQLSAVQPVSQQVYNGTDANHIYVITTFDGDYTNGSGNTEFIKYVYFELQNGQWVPTKFGRS
jgi:hypothetical protein